MPYGVSACCMEGAAGNDAALLLREFNVISGGSHKYEKERRATKPKHAQMSLNDEELNSEKVVYL